MSVTHGMDFEQYLALEGYSNTGLGYLLKSPAHYQAYLVGDRKPTPAMMFGTLLHTAVLEPDSFDCRYGVQPAGDGRTAAVKAAREKWATENPGIIPISSEDGYAAAHMGANIREHKRLCHLFDGGQREVTMQWTDPITGLACKGRADLWHPELGMILDLKTTTDASPGEFGKSAGRLGYYRQAAFYVDGMLRAANLLTPPTFLFAAVEKTPPYAVQVYMLHPDAMIAGRDSYLAALDTAKRCEQTGVWPAYSEDVQVLTVPKYLL